MDRREFLYGGAAGLTLAALQPRVFAAAGDKPKRVGLIGSGWYGKADLLRLIQVSPVEVVSLCDVDKVMLQNAGELVASRQANKKTPRLYEDYRDLLKERDLDIAVIGTPDHWHALPAIAAMEAGCDLYLQKPISLDVAEGAAILAAVRKHKRVVQIGTQRRSTPHLIDAKKKVVDAGLLGKVGLVEVYCYYHMRAKDNPPDGEAPANLNYDLWTGPAPLKPYNKLVHPRSWRAFQRYGNGIVGDMCVHMLDTARWLLNLGWPTSVSSEGGILIDKASKADIPDTQTAVFEFPEFPVVWTHRSWGDAPDPEYPWGLTIYGEKGTLKASVMKYDFLPRGKGEKLHQDVVMELEEFPEDKTEKDLEKHVAPAIRGHMKNLLECIETRAKPVADIEQGHISTASCILANLALQTGRTLHWDADKGAIKNDDEANKLLKRPYRAPWVHPADVT
ncbi:MAG: Gfo/Idh/MocA family oxidoreductase [Pirellulales bacterium]